MRTLVLTFVVGFVAAALGWITVGQVTITMATEIVVAFHLGNRRALVSQGPVLMAEKLRYQIGDRTVDHPHGTPMTPEAREGFAGTTATLVITFAVALLTFFVLAVTRDAEWPTWWQVVAWISWSAVLVGTTWREHTAWMASEDRLTADPSSHTYGAGTRVLSLFCVALLAAFVPWGPSVVAALLLGEVLAHNHVRRRQQAVTVLLGADVHPTAGSRSTVNQRLPQPDPHWTPEPGWAPPDGWYGPVPGWERQADGTWQRTSDHPLHGVGDHDGS